MRINSVFGIFTTVNLLSPTLYNPIYGNALFRKHCSIHGFNPPPFFFFYIVTSLLCISSSHSRHGVWVKEDVSLVGNELIKNPYFLESFSIIKKIDLLYHCIPCSLQKN